VEDEQARQVAPDEITERDIAEVMDYLVMSLRDAAARDAERGNDGVAALLRAIADRIES
jgi:hypothetical protein